MLKGIKVLDFSTLLPGPYATLMLEELGAEVIQVINPNAQKFMIEPSINKTSVIETILNGNKETLELNLKTHEAIKIIKSLIIEYDIIVEQFRPGVMDKLGLGYESLSEINPQLIYCSISGFGRSSNKVGHDINFVAESGVATLLSKIPHPIGTQLGDLVGGSLHATIGILAALVKRERTGEGELIDISMTECLNPLTLLYSGYTTLRKPQPEIGKGLLDGGSIYDFYETKDGKFIAVGSLEPKFFINLMKGLELTGIVPDSNGEYLFDRETKKKIVEKIRTKTQEEWTAIFEGIEACVNPVNTVEGYLSKIGSKDGIPQFPIRFKYYNPVERKFSH